MSLKISDLESFDSGDDFFSQNVCRGTADGKFVIF